MEVYITEPAKMTNLIETEYCLTLQDIKKILGVSENWIRININPSVKYINIKKYLRYVNIGTKYYYYSKKEFEKWFLTNSIMTRQTIVVDGINYRNKNVTEKEFERLIYLLNSKNEKYDYSIDLGNKLNMVGKLLINNMILNVTKRDEEHIIINNFIPHFENIIYPNTYDCREKVYRESYRNGYIKIKIKSKKILFLKENIEKFTYPITVPYRVYSEIKNKK